MQGYVGIVLLWVSDRHLWEEVNQAGSLDQWDEGAEVRVENLERLSSPCLKFLVKKLGWGADEGIEKIDRGGEMLEIYRRQNGRLGGLRA